MEMRYFIEIFYFFAIACLFQYYMLKLSNSFYAVMAEFRLFYADVTVAMEKDPNLSDE